MKTDRFWFNQLPSGASPAKFVADSALFSVCPNPAEDVISIWPVHAPQGRYVVSILNVLGLVVQKTEMILDGSLNTLRQNISILDDGNLFIHMAGSSLVQTICIV